MLRPKDCLTLILCLSLSFFLLSSSIVSSLMVASRNALAASDGESEEDNSETEQQDVQEDEQAFDGGGDEQSEEGQQEDGISQEPLLGDGPSEAQPQEGDQPVACSGVVNPETGECGEIEQPQDGSAEICDNSVDDDLDGSADMDGSDCSSDGS